MKVVIIIEDMPGDQVNFKIEFDPPVTSETVSTAASDAAVSALSAIRNYIQENQSDI